MSGWILVACCAGLVGIGLYLLLTAPPIGPYDDRSPFQRCCVGAGKCDQCRGEG